jgi:serine protease Do
MHDPLDLLAVDSPDVGITGPRDPIPGPSSRTVLLVVAAAFASALVASALTVSVALAPRTAGPATTSASATPVAAQGPAATAVLAVDSGSVVDVARRVSPAVVTITSSTDGNRFDPLDLPSTGVGSGFVFRADGWILTNAHVVEGATDLVVTLKGGREYAGRIVTADQEADLAIVKIEAAGLPTAEIGASAGLEVGQLVVAIGSPLGTFTDSVTSGILSAVGRSITVRDEQTRQRRTISNLLQTDAAINPGNSGGPLLDSGGRVIGINTAIASSAAGIGFAIPIDAARSIMERATGG